MNTAFMVDIGAALIMGLAIGAERQLTQHPAGLRTNALVSVGAAMFVSLSLLLDDEASPTRVAAQVASGIGFLGGGVILREGLNVKGMTTAATLWCSGAVGCLAGAGFVVEGLMGTATILAANFCLHPVSRWMDARAKAKVMVETSYRLRVTCEDREEGVIRTILMRHVNAHPSMLIQGIATQAADQPGTTLVNVDIHSTARDDRALQDVVSRINIEPGVTAASWERRQ